MVVNAVDPDVIVMGGGMSNVPELYEAAGAADRTHLQPLLLLDYFGRLGTLQVNRKDAKDFVTEADVEVERLIRGRRGRAPRGRLPR